MINKESITNNIAEVRSIESEITSRSSDLIATPLITAIWEKAVEIDRLVKTQTKALDDLKSKLKEFMGDATVLISPSGEEMATWKHDKASIKLCEDTLELMFPQAYKECLFLKDGAKKFCLK